MKATREVRRVLDWYRHRESRRGKKNGSLGVVDNPWIERTISRNSKKIKRLRREKILP